MPDPTLRFAVGNPDGLSSNSWRVWARPDGDVYISCRDNYKELKVSLHRSGRWRVGLTDIAAGRLADRTVGGSNRAWDVWDRPDPMVPGITMGFVILFFPSELSITPSLRSASSAWARGETEIIPTASEPAVATVTLNDPGYVLAAARANAQYQRFLPLSSGREVQLLVHTEPLGRDSAEVQSLRAPYEEVCRRCADLNPPSGARVFLGSRRDSDGHRFATEVNYHRPDDDPLNLR
jgi:hypothetical protein